MTDPCDHCGDASGRRSRHRSGAVLCDPCAREALARSDPDANWLAGCVCGPKAANPEVGCECGYADWCADNAVDPLRLVGS